MRYLIALVFLLMAGCASQPQGLVLDEAAPLAATGQIAAGEQVFAAREQGHCVLCHQVKTLDAPFQGNIGPDLTRVGARLTATQIRYRIMDASRLNPATTMPPYYRVERLNQVAPEFKNKTALTAVQIENLVAYLEQLK